MLGTFDLYSIGKFIVSGDDLEDFLWDLFDQIALSSNLSLNLGGIKTIVPNQDAYFNDQEERLSIRGTDEWKAIHNAYLSSGVDLGLGKNKLLELHSARLIERITEDLQDSFKTMRKINIAMYKYGHGTPEYNEAINNIDCREYKYEDYSPVNIINFLLVKNILDIKYLGNLAELGIMSRDQVAVEQEKIRLEDRAEKELERDLTLGKYLRSKEGKSPRKGSSKSNK